MGGRRIRPLSSPSDNQDADGSGMSSKSSTDGILKNQESTSYVSNSDASSYLKLKPFTALDPTLRKLLVFLNCFGLTINYIHSDSVDRRNVSNISKYLKVSIVMIVSVLSLDVAMGLNVKHSKLLSEQKRAAPLLTFVIVAYSVSTIMLPIICSIFLMIAGSHLFRFYSRTTATVCDGKFFGQPTFVDSYLYYITLIIIAFLDSISQMITRGVWPMFADPYMRMMIPVENKPIMSTSLDTNKNLPIIMSHDLMSNSIENHTFSDRISLGPERDKINTILLDSILGHEYAHNDVGICIKALCLMIQFVHSNAVFIIITSLANHYATILNNINENLEKYESRMLLKQLIILRDSSEQISIMMSLPFALVIQLIFTRQIALIGVFIQSTMQTYENTAILMQAFTSGVALFTVFIFCDGLQNASKQTHRLKTEQTVIDDSRGGDQSIYEFLDYLCLLSKSIRITFFNIIAINKNSLVSLYGHILTLTFVTS